MKKYNESESKFNKLERQLDVLIVLQCLPSIPSSDKLTRMDAHFKDFPVQTMCAVLDVSPGTFYNHHSRRFNWMTQTDRRTKLANMIIKISEESNRRFGADKIVAILKMKGDDTSSRLVSSIMRENNLQCDLIIKKKRKERKPEDGNKRQLM